MRNIIGNIYCYSDGKLLQPAEYKKSRRTTAEGIVLSNNHNIVRIASVQVHNDSKPYQFMEGKCLFDFPSLGQLKLSLAKMDLCGKRNTDMIRHIASDFKCNVLSELDNYKSDGWYLPSLGELVRLYSVRSEMLSSLESAKLTKNGLYNLMTEGGKVITSTQADKYCMYSMDLSTGIIELTNKTEMVYSIGFKMGRMELLPNLFHRL